MPRHAIAVLLLGLILAFAACGDDEEPTEPTEPTVTGLDLETCAEPEYGGEREPAGLIVSDLPMQGDSAERSTQQVDAIRLVLERADWQAGDTTVAFQACDDSVAKTGLWDVATCRSNAKAYAGDERVLGVIGTYNSGCAAEEIPILNRADVAMISPGNTAICLTQKAPTCVPGQPETLYPTGERNYARVVPNDAFQSAALAQFASQNEVERPLVLYAADDSTSTGQAGAFRGAARSLGLDVVGFSTWDPGAGSYKRLFSDAERKQADGVILAGLTEQNGARVIEDKVAVLGPNDAVPLLAFDGFAQQTTIDEAGDAARGMFASLPGSAPESLTGEGAALVEDLEAELDSGSVEQFAPYAGEAAAVLLDAIATAGTERDAIVDAVFETEGGGGIFNSYDIEPSGDPNVGPVTILEARSSFETDEEIAPEAKLVDTARG